MSDDGVIAVDLDGTLAEYWPGHWKDAVTIGRPIPAMKKRVEQWLADGKRVKIWTARVAESLGPRLDGYSVDEIKEAIWRWLIENIDGWEKIETVTAEKTWLDVELWDDRAVHVVLNTGLERRAMLQAHMTHLVEENRELRRKLRDAGIDPS